MNILHVFLLSVFTFLLFKLLSPIILGFLKGILGAAVNMSVLNAVTFGVIFLAIYKLNQMVKFLDV